MSNAPLQKTEKRLGRNVDAVRRRIRESALRAGRDPAEVTLVAITKSAPATILPLLAAVGVTDIGENRIQVAEEKFDRAPAGLRRHLVGHLQRNKARRALSLFSVIHSLDSLRLLRTLDRIVEETGLTVVKGLVQVNVSGEDQKYGVAPDAVRDLLLAAASLPRVEVTGLMGMAPFVDDPEEARSSFRRLARIRDDANEVGWYRVALTDLSMGMTNDFEVAVEEGATMVRVGTALFEGIENADSPTPGSEDS